VPRGQYVKFNASALLRTDTLNRYQAHAIALETASCQSMRCATSKTVGHCRKLRRRRVR
jgi:hypothetical protein